MKSHLSLAALIAVAVCMSARPAHAKIPDAQNEMVHRVLDRLVAYCDPPEGYSWPPEVQIEDVDEINARCFNSNADPQGQVQPKIVVDEGLMTTIVGNDENRLAFVLAHELNHALLGHIVHPANDPRGRTGLLNITFTREQETAADKGGLALAVRANFSHQGAIDAMKEMIKQDLDYSSFEGLGVNHPSWKDRLAEIDQEQPMLWHAMAAFHSGSALLGLEQYGAAVQYFQHVTDEFPDCPEAWANIGYARLMMYCDSLTDADLRAMGISQMVVGGFYDRPASLIGRVRGDKKLWTQAIDALKKSLALDKSLTLARANLGLAYLVDTDGKHLPDAMHELSEATAKISADQSMEPSVAEAILINTGVANLASGENDDAAADFARAASFGQTSRGTHLLMASAVRSALLYNRAQMLGDSTLPENQRQALASLNQYFKLADPDGAWWPLAYERYGKLCRQLGELPVDNQALIQNATSRKRPVSQVTTKSGQTITLGESFAELEKGMHDKALRVNEVPNTDFVRLCYPAEGIDVLGTDQVLGICLHGPLSPGLPIRAAELGSAVKSIHCGMTLDELEKIIGQQRTSFEPLTDANQQYTVYRDLQLSIGLENGKVTEIVVALVPETIKQEKK